MKDEDELLQDQDKIKAQREEADKARAEHELVLKDWREVLDSPSGRRITGDILGSLKLWEDLLRNDPLIMAANCALHKEALKILKLIEEAVPGVYNKMTNELRSAQGRKK